MSGVACHVSCVRCHLSCVMGAMYICFFLSSSKLVKLVVAGSVINEAIPSSF